MALHVTGAGGVPAAGVSAVVLNVTVTEPTAESFLTAWPAGQTRPTASNLNYLAGQTSPNLVVVTVGDAGTVDLYNNLGSTHLVADVAGWFSLDGSGVGSGYTSLTRPACSTPGPGSEQRRRSSDPLPAWPCRSPASPESPPPAPPPWC